MFGRWRVSERRTPQFRWKMQASKMKGRKDGKLKRPNNLRNGGKCVGRRSAERVEVMTEMPQTCNALRLGVHDSTRQPSYGVIFSSVAR